MWYRNLIFLGMCGVFAAGLWAYVVPDQRQVGRDAAAATNIERRSIREIVETVDGQFRTDWDNHSLRPASTADELTIARRLSLSLTGTIPSLEDLRILQSQPEATRLAWWTDHLLADRRHADYFAERLARVYVGVEQGPFLIYRRRRFVTWLSDQLQSNKPYDQLVRELITAEGLWTDSPEVNFLTVNADEAQGNRPDPVRLAGRTTRAFLGLRLDCVQCHDDHLGGPWLQSDFHQLAAFYSEPTSSLVGIRDEPKPYEYQYGKAAESEVIPPSVPFGHLNSPEKTAVRQQLADWITHPENRAFSRAIVNRLWALAFGKPLVEPVDSIPLTGPYPPGLESLTQDFVNHQYDLRRLWQVITSLETFRLSSRAEFELKPEHERRWAAFPVTRLRAEQVAGAMVQSAKLTTIDANSHIIVRAARAGQVNDFVQRYGDSGQDEFDSDGGTIPQRLLMLNGELVRELTQDDLISNAATRIALLAPGDREAVEATYLATLTRKPTEAEADYFLEKLRLLKVPNRAEFFGDLYWTLFNSTEFSWNH